MILSVFLPFAAGYYLSYLFRTINASISPALASEFGLDAGQTGLLASVYFLAFAVAQIPIGVLIDRYGPRRVQSVLLVIAVGGATLFGTAGGFIELIAARSMIGLGASAALMAGLKAVVIWFPRDRIALVNGWMIMLGSLGALTATAPTDWLLGWIGWRGLFEILTFAALTMALITYVTVPEREMQSDSTATSQRSLTLWSIYSDTSFLRIAPLSATCIGSSWALQSLWVAPWLIDVEGLDRPSAMTQLLFMAIGLSFGAMLLGTIADRLRRRGVRTEVLLAAMAGLFVMAQLALLLRLPLPSIVPWSIVAITGAATVLSFAAIVDYFPQRFAARANGALNLLHFGWAFVVQYGTGLILGQWSPHEGHYPAVAYQVALGFIVALQVVALIWFAMPWIRRLNGNIWRLFVPLSAVHHNRGGSVLQPTDGPILEVEGAEW